MSVSSYKLMALAGVTCISFAPIIVRVADAGDVTIAFFRALYAIPVLGILWWATRRKDTRPTRSRLIALLSGGFLGLDLTLWHASIGEIGAGLATVLVNMQVVFVATIAWVFFRERPARWSLGMLPVMLIGIVLISGLGAADAYGNDPARGTALGLLSAVFYASFVLLLRQSTRGHPSPPTGPVFDATVGTAIVTLFIGLAFAPDFDLAITWPLHGWLFLLAMLAQVIGWLLIALALPQLPALDASVLLLAQPMMAILWARLIFTEAMGLTQWVGVSLVLLGLLGFTLRESRRPRQETGKPVQEPL